jgi:hypothetical protein
MILESMTREVSPWDATVRVAVVCGLPERSPGSQLRLGKPHLTGNPASG